MREPTGKFSMAFLRKQLRRHKDRHGRPYPPFYITPEQVEYMKVMGGVDRKEMAGVRLMCAEKMSKIWNGTENAPV